jgi:hypothetical protein
MTFMQYRIIVPRSLGGELENAGRPYFPFPLCNLKTTEDFGFIFGGMMYEMSKVCLVKESAESASRLCHQGTKPLNTKSVIMPLIKDGISPNFVVGSSINCSCYIILFFDLIDFWLTCRKPMQSRGIHRHLQGTLCNC